MSLCKCGCGETTPLAKRTRQDLGHVRGEHLDYIRGHNARRSPEPYRVTETGFSSPCWLWLRSINLSGYGMVTVDGRSKQAHVAYWEAANGPVPDSLELDHLCRRRACVNPAHLEAVTHQENVWRGWIARFVRADAPVIKTARVEAGLSQAAAARLVGCAQTALSAWERGINPLSPERRDQLLSVYEETRERYGREAA